MTLAVIAKKKAKINHTEITVFFPHVCCVFVCVCTNLMLVG